MKEIRRRKFEEQFSVRWIQALHLMSLSILKVKQDKKGIRIHFHSAVHYIKGQLLPK